MSDFILDSQLAKDSLFVTDLSLCQLRLINDSHYPWLILIPRLVDIVEVIDISQAQQMQLWRESARICAMLKDIHSPEKLNVAAIGNKVRQCHIHHIARFTRDKAWPEPVWGKHSAESYTDNRASELIRQYHQFLSN